MDPGRLVIGGGRCTPIQEVRAQSCLRYHLGYCRCGERITVDPDMADGLVRAFVRRSAYRPKIPIRQRIANLIYSPK